MKKSLLKLLPTLVTLISCQLSLHAAITAGQVDDFSDDTTDGWTTGSGFVLPGPGDPSNISDGGPNGTGDNFLRYQTSGSISGPRSRLVFYNTDQWAGDYLSQGITGIRMDFKLFTPGKTVNMRIALGSIFGANGNTWYASTDSIDVTSGATATDWQSIYFPISTSTMSLITGFAGDTLTLEELLGNVVSVRILSSTVPFNRGDASGLQNVAIGVDNITAVAVPEPSTVTALTLLLLSLPVARSLRKKR